MGIQNFPAALQPIIQQNFLEREFQDGLQSRLAFRQIADRETFNIGIGESITKTRTGLKAPVEEPTSAAATNSNLDNGMTASGWTVEQFSLTINQYNDTIDLNMVGSLVGIKSQFMKNARVNGVQSAQSLDRLARNALYNAYLGGNTRVTATLGAPAATIAVDDIRGFQYVTKNGVLIPVSATDSMACTVGGDAYTLQVATPDATNVSTAPRGISGTLLFSANVAVIDGTAGMPVVSGVAPLVIRPNGRLTTTDLTKGVDLLTYDMCLRAVARLRDDNVPGVGGGDTYPCYLDNTHLLQLFADQQFQYLYRGQANDQAQKKAVLEDLLGLRFVPTTEAPQQNLAGVGAVKRAIIVGQGALVEGSFEATGYSNIVSDDGLKVLVDGVCMITREPLDRLQQIIAQSWYWIGGYAVPTDITANTSIIPTASNAYHRRAVVLETSVR